MSAGQVKCDLVCCTSCTEYIHAHCSSARVQSLQPRTAEAPSGSAVACAANNKTSRNHPRTVAFFCLSLPCHGFNVRASMREMQQAEGSGPSHQGKCLNGEEAGSLPHELRCDALCCVQVRVMHHASSKSSINYHTESTLTIFDFLLHICFNFQLHILLVWRGEKLKPASFPMRQHQR